MPENNLNLLKFRTGATESTDIANNIARLDLDSETLIYSGKTIGVSKDQLQGAVAGKVDTTAFTETLKNYALTADVPTTSAIEAIADSEIAKANKNTTLTNYATTGEVNTLKQEVSGKTTMSEVEAKGYITSASTVSTANKTTGTLTVQKNSSNIGTFNGSGNTTIDITVPTKVSELTNDSKFITSGTTVATAKKTSGTLTIQKNSTDVGKFNGSGNTTIDITVPTKVSELTNDSQYLTNADTIAQADHTTGTLTIQKNSTNVGTFNGDNSTVNIEVPTKVSELSNDSNFITTASTVAQSNKTTGTLTVQKNGTSVGTFNGSGNTTVNITVPTKTSDITNDSNFITSGATVAQANKLTNALTIQKNGTSVGTFNGSGNTTVNVTVPTKTSEITNDSNFITSGATVATALNANTVGGYAVSAISAMTNDTSKIGNGAGYITKSVTDLTNYYTKSSIDTLMSSKLSRTIVASLPTSGSANVIYMVPKSTAETNNIYDEYLYIDSAWEFIGTSKTDLSDYYKKSETSGKTEISNALAGKASSSHTHTTSQITGLGSMALQPTSAYSSATEVKNALAGKASSSHTHDDRYYTESEMDSKLAGKSDTGHTHTSGEVTGLNTMALQPTSAYSSATEVRTALSGKANASHTHSSGDITGLGTMALQATGSYSTATDVKNALAGKASSSHTHTSANITDALKSTSKNHAQWSSANSGLLITESVLAFWNGATTSANASNLTYCNKGAFGTMATADSSSYSSASQVNTALAGKASSSHTHTSGQVTGLNTMALQPTSAYSSATEVKNALAGKSNTGHTHTSGEVTGLNTMALQPTSAYSSATEVKNALAGKASSSHTHASGDVTGLGTMALQPTSAYSSATEVKNALAGKASSSHTHTSGQVTGLNTMALQPTSAYSSATEVSTALASKASSSHTHKSADISDKVLKTAKDSLVYSSSNSALIPTMSMLAYWNGAYNSGGSSNLTYCNKGAFGTMATMDSSSYSSASQVNTALAGKASSSHTHDDRYYTESEIDSKLAGKSDTGHTHSYLPLSGGTVTGKTVFTTSDYGTQIEIKRSNANDSVITYSNSAGTLGLMGFSAGSVPYMRTGTSNTNYFLLHSGNSAHTHDYVSYIKDLGTHTEPASSSSTAGTKFSGCVCGTTQGLFLTESYNDSNTPTNYGNILTIKGNGGGQLYCGWEGSYNTGKLYYRSHRDNMGSGGWTPWSQIAMVSDVSGSYLPLTGGRITGDVSFSGNVWAPKSFSQTGVIDYTSASGFTTTTVTGSGMQVYGNIHNCSYTFVGNNVRVQSNLYSTNNYLNYVTAGTLNLTGSVYGNTASTYFNGYWLNVSGVNAGYISGNDIYGTLHGTASQADYCPNYVPMSGATSGSPISGELYFASGKFGVKCVAYGVGITNESTTLKLYAGSTSFSVDSTSQSANTISSATSSNGAGRTLMDAYGIQQYVTSLITNTITITI